MEKELFKIIQKHFPDSNNDLNNWKLVCKNSNTIPSNYHSLNRMRYFVAYFSKERSINLSLIIYEKNQPLGVFPLMVHKNKLKGWIISSNGIEIIEPIFIKSLTLKARKKIEKKLKDLIYELANYLKINDIQLVNIGFFKLSSWYAMWAEDAKEIFSTHHLLVDLSLNIEEIRLKFRKSFKPLINKGLREWSVEVHEEVSDELFEKFKKLHFLVAGRLTRPKESWDKLRVNIEARETFIVTVTDKNNCLIGAGLFTYSKDSAYYGMGVYNRKFFNKPVGHAVQMIAIQTLKNKGLKWYEIGQKHMKIDKILPTEKELSISYFKEGFATNMIARQHLLVNINKY